MISATARERRAVLVVGVSRSGTTWISEALARCRDVTYVHEPDNDPPLSVEAIRALTGADIESYPFVQPGDRTPSEYARLWDVAFGRVAPRPAAHARRRLAHHLLHRLRRGSRLRVVAATRLLEPLHGDDAGTMLVKSVHAALAVQWIADRIGARVLVVRRHPFSILASWRTMGIAVGRRQIPDEAVRYFATRWGCDLPPPGATPFEEAAWRVGFLTSALDDVADHHPEYTVAEHELVCRDPHNELAALAVNLGIDWTAAASAFVQEADRPGTGWELRRVATDQLDVWRHSLSPDEARAAADVLLEFPVGRRWDLVR